MKSVFESISKLSKINIKGLIAVLVLSLVPTFSVTSSASANLVVDANNATFDFDKNDVTNFVGNGRSSGDKVLFKNVLSIPGGITLDALVTTTIVNTSAGTDPDRVPTINAFDQQTTSGAQQYLDLSVDGPLGNFEGYINLNFVFYDNSNTYSGPNTGSIVTLQNVSVFSLDVDSTTQFTDFRGFQNYYVNNPTRIRVNDASTTNGVGTSPFVRFLSGNGASGSNNPQDSVQVEYLSLTSLDARVGNAVSGGGAYFAIGFGQWDWNGGTAGLGTPNPIANPINARPTSSNNSIYVPTTGNFTLEKRHFGNYSDPDGNAFDKIQVITLPASGTLQRLQSGVWTNVSANDYVPVSAIDSGELRIAMSATSGTSDTSFTFEVNDSQIDSASAYTLTLNVVTTPQTITFNNPGTRALSTTVTETATASSGLTTTLTSSTTGICTISGGNIVSTGVAGPCTVTATQDGNYVYSSAPSVTQTFYFSNDAAQAITYVAPTDKSISVGNFTDTATASSGLTVTLTSLTSSTCTVSGFVVTLVSSGSCQIRASQGGGAISGTTYAPASPVTRNFNIFAATAQTITFAQPSSKNVGDSFASNATASSGLTVTLSSANTGICTVSGLTINAVAVGTCSITASQGGGSSGGNTYAAATAVTRSFTISAAPVVVIPTNAVFFDANTGTGYMNPQYGVTGTTVFLDKNLYTKAGYRFVGWNVRADGTGTAFKEGASLGLTNDVRLYAQWEFIRKVPVVTWANPDPINNKTPLSGLQLNANSTTPGTYVYSPAAGTLLAPGKHKLKVIFTPTDAINFEPIEVEVEITVVEQKAPTLTWANPEEIVFGTLLSQTQLNATASVDGTFDYGNQSGLLLPVGTHVLTVTFKPKDALNYSEIKGTVSIIVIEKLEPVANILTTPYQTTRESGVNGLKTGATMVVVKNGPGIASSVVNGSTVTVVPQAGFAGVTSIVLRATLGKQVVDFNKTVNVLPAIPTGSIMKVLSGSSTQLNWNSVPSAVKYEATLNGEVLCSTGSTSCVAEKILGPKSNVKLVAIADGDLKSGEASVKYRSPDSPVIAKIENFATASFQLRPNSRRELREFAAEVRELGFTRLQVQGHTDIRGGVDNNVLSRNRAQETIKFLQRLLPGVKFKLGYFASTKPIGDNSTKEGLATNRRVEIAVW